MFNKKPKTSEPISEKNPSDDGGHCILFTSYLELDRIKEALKDFDCHEQDGSLNVSQSLVIIRDDGGYFQEQKEGMSNFMMMMADPENAVHKKFFKHLESCETGYRVEYRDKKKATEIINALLNHSHGLLFNPDMTFYAADWKIIIDSSGACELKPEEYQVFMSTETFDKKLPTPSPESEERKRKTISLLQEKGIPVLDSLPTSPDSTQIELRDAQTLVKRIIALAVVSLKGDLKKSDESFAMLEKFRMLPSDVSPKELSFLQNANPTAEELNAATWRYESLNVLMWAVGYQEELLFPSDMASVQELLGVIQNSENKDSLLNQLSMKSISEILDELDLNYRLHWACKNAMVKKIDFPEGIHPSVIYERHYALNWLTDANGAEWDNTSTAT